MVENLYSWITGIAAKFLGTFFSPIETAITNKGFIVDNPFLIGAIYHKYWVLVIIVSKFVGIYFLANVVFMLISGDFIQITKYRKIVGDTAITILLLVSNHILLLWINTTTVIFAEAIKAGEAPIGVGILLTALGAIAVGLLTPVGLLAIGIGFLLIFFLLVGIDVLNIVIGTLAVVSPILISVYAIPVFRNMTETLYVTYFKLHLIVVFQLASLFVINAFIGATVNPLNVISLIIASVIVLIIIIPIVVFKSTSSMSSGLG